MRKLLIVLGCTLVLALVFSLAMNASERKQVAEFTGPQAQAPAITMGGEKAACQLTGYNGTPSYYITDYGTGDQTVQYIDPVDCGATTTYPFEVQSLDFSLYDDGGTMSYPVQVDLVVYEMATPGNPCAGPGAELSRVTASCGSSFNYPSQGTISLSSPSCVTGPFFVGIEYSDQGAGPFPSMLFDNNLTPDSCDLYMYNWFGEPVWTEWYEAHWSGMIGYPSMWVNGETNSSGCGSSQPLAFDNCPPSLSYDHCNVASYDFDVVEGSIPEIMFSLISGPGSVDGNTGEWTYSPSLEDVLGQHIICVVVSDVGGDSDTCCVSVQFTNVAPVFTSTCPDSISVASGEIANYQFVADPVDCDPVIYSIDDVPPPIPAGFFSINSGNGSFTFESDITDAGYLFEFTIACDDGNDLPGDLCSFKIYVGMPDSLEAELFSQIDFVFDSVQQINSDWGSVEVDVNQILNEYGAERLYMNCWYDSGWFVQNLIIDSAMADSIKTYFGLKIPPGTDVTELPVYIQYSLYPLMSFSDGPRVTYDVGVREFNAEGVSLLGESNTVIPIAPEPVIFVDPVENLETVWKNIPGENVECAANQCVSMSVANSLQWLENTYSSIDVPHDHLPGRDGDSTLVGQLDGYMNRWSESRSRGAGLGPANMVQGKFDYLKANGLEDKVVMKHQVEDEMQTIGFWDPMDAYDPDDSSVYSRDETSAGGHVTWDWIYREINDGEDVEMLYGYYDEAGNFRGGHAVRVFGAGKTNGRPWLMVKHDALQTNRDPGDSLGLQEWFQWVDTLDNGRMTFGSPTQKVAFAFSESPVDHEPRLHFYQLDFLLDSILYSNSDWGTLDFAMSPDADTNLVYLNVTVNGSWQVQNIPLWPPTPDEGEVTVAIDFDLGVPSGTSISWVTYGYSLTSAPVGGSPAESGSTIVVDRQVVMFAGGAGEEAEAPKPAAPAEGGAVADPVKHAHKEADFPNQECGGAECVPAAVSNSLKFLNKRHNMGLDDADLGIDKMKTATNWGEKDLGGGQTGTGAWQWHDNNRAPGERKAWYENKKEYMEKNKIPITTRRITDISLIAAEIDAGQDVELQVPGHVAAVVSITDLGGGKYKLEVKHDILQGQDGGLEKQVITYNPTTKKFEKGKWIDGKPLLDFIVECPKKEPTPGKNMHNQDEYVPPDGDPTGTLWHELWPNFCVMWELSDWEDNGDGKLSSCDYVTFTNQSSGDESREHIEEVTATITIVPVGKLDDTLYFDFWYGRPDMAPIIPEPGDQWHEIYPEYCTMYEVESWEDNGTGKLDSCDYLLLRTTSGANAGNVEMYHVEAIETDIVTIPAPLPTTCCVGPIRGNVNNDPGDDLDISDLVYLVDFMFTGGPAPVCMDEADINGSGSIDISDLVALVDYMFTGGPPPAPCP